MVTATRTDIQKSHDDFYGLTCFLINGKEYAAASIEQAELAARELAKECLDLVDTALILKHSCLPPQAASIVRYVQDGLRGGGDEVDLLIPVIHNLDALIDEAVVTFGRSHFLGVFANGIELSLVQFPQWIADFILQELGLESSEQVCVYQLA
ncbi:MAG: hypothetical protein KME13_25115 [Myxacorys californica WJT36-NPBG1]|jgi:hypothetical protein|nr:hypothetical protein [Myxacorys californica WJT36-NPBG1]